MGIVMQGDGLLARLKQRLAEIAELRKTLASKKADMKTATDAFTASMAPINVAVKAAAEKLAGAEAEAQTLTLEVFDLDKTNKKPVPGVEVKEFTETSYDAKKVFAFCKSKGLGIIETLDEKAFLAIAATLSDEQKAELGYTEKKVPRAQLAKDLDKVLATTTEAGGVEAPAA